MALSLLTAVIRGRTRRSLHLLKDELILHSLSKCAYVLRIIVIIVHAVVYDARSVVLVLEIAISIGKVAIR